MGTRRGEVRLAFGTEERAFRLGIAEWRQVQERCNAGPVELLRRLTAGDWRVDDVREIMLQGLIGGGMDSTLSGITVRNVLDEAPLTKFVQGAYMIALASLSGPEDEPLGEKTTATPRKRTTRSRAAKSASPKSTPPGN